MARLIFSLFAENTDIFPAADIGAGPLIEMFADRMEITNPGQLNGYKYLKSLDIGHFFYSGSFADDILKVQYPVC